MINLSEREKIVLDSIPIDRWVNQLELGTSKRLLSVLHSAKLIKKKVIPNPTRDPRKGIVYRRV